MRKAGGVAISNPDRAWICFADEADPLRRNVGALRGRIPKMYPALNRGPDEASFYSDFFLQAPRSSCVPQHRGRSVILVDCVYAPLSLMFLRQTFFEPWMRALGPRMRVEDSLSFGKGNLRGGFHGRRAGPAARTEGCGGGNSRRFMVEYNIAKVCSSCFSAGAFMCVPRAPAGAGGVTKLRFEVRFWILVKVRSCR